MHETKILKKASVNSVTKKEVVVFEVYVDGFRVGFVKFRGEAWHASEWNTKHIDKFDTQREAIERVVLNYQIVRKHWTQKKIERFEKRAMKLPEAEGIDQESFGNW